MSPVLSMIVTRSKRHYRPSFCMEGVAMEEIALEEIATDNWSSVLVEEERKREVPT